MSDMIYCADIYRRPLLSGVDGYTHIYLPISYNRYITIYRNHDI